MSSLFAGNRSVDQLGDRLRSGERRPLDFDASTEYRRFVAQDLVTNFGAVQAVAIQHPAVTAARVKRLDSIVRKLVRQPRMDLSRMDDLVGLRVIVADPRAQDEVVAGLLVALPGAKHRDYVKEPQASGYRAHHLIVPRMLKLPNAEAASKYTFEVQIRTYFQHLWSSTSESFGEQVKEGGGSDEVRAYLLELADGIASVERESPEASQLSLLHTTGDFGLFAVQYDHGYETLLRCDRLGADISDALQHFSYLEGLVTSPSEREVVLLGCAATEDELRVTHLRYFQPRGIPDLPRIITPRRERPR